MPTIIYKKVNYIVAALPIYYIKPLPLLYVVAKS